jgi:iron-sulfur cluster assembly protein
MNTEETQVSTQGISIMPEAAEQIRNIRRENQIPETHGLRIGIQGGGCCGPSYMLAFDDKVDATDKVILSEGITLYVDEESFEGMAGAILEYVDGPQGKGFKFNNPNQSKSCGCDDSECGDGSCGDQSNGESGGGCGCGGH